MIWSSIEDMEKGIYDDVEEICEAVHYRLSRKGPSINDVNNFFSNILTPSLDHFFSTYALWLFLKKIIKELRTAFKIPFFNWKWTFGAGQATS